MGPMDLDMCHMVVWLESLRTHPEGSIRVLKIVEARMLVRIQFKYVATSIRRL